MAELGENISHPIRPHHNTFPFIYCCSIKKKSGLEFSDMLFFDDEERNRRQLASIGVLQVIVKGGVTRELVRKGLTLYAK